MNAVQSAVRIQRIDCSLAAAILISASAHGLQNLLPALLLFYGLQNAV